MGDRHRPAADARPAARRSGRPRVRGRRHGRIGGVSEAPGSAPSFGIGRGAPCAARPGRRLRRRPRVRTRGMAVGDAVAKDGTDHPVRWDAAGRITDLGLPQGSRTAQATGVLPGGVVVGTAQVPAPGGGAVTQAVRWTAPGNPQLLSGQRAWAGRGGAPRRNSGGLPGGRQRRPASGDVAVRAMKRIVVLLTVVALACSAAIAAPWARRPCQAATTFSFAVAGDLGANSHTSAVLNAVAASGSQIFFPLGDLSYSQVTPESAWCDFVQRPARRELSRRVCHRQPRGQRRARRIHRQLLVLPARPDRRRAGHLSEGVLHDYPRQSRSCGSS